MSKTHTAIAGEYAVMAYLSMHGLDVNITLKNTKGMDIIASNPITGNMYRVEVKTTAVDYFMYEHIFGRTYSWMMSNERICQIAENLIYVFVKMNTEQDLFKFFVVPSDIVKKAVQAEHMRYITKENICVPGDRRTFRIGIDDFYDYYIPLAKDYENKWDTFLSPLH
jgi:hypothetical protein